MATYFSIDPGESVGVAVQNGSGSYLFVGTIAEPVFLSGVYETLFRTLQPTAVIMERMPTGNHHSISIRVSTHVTNLCEITETPYVLVSPGIWKPIAPKQIANPLAVHMNDAMRLLYYVMNFNPGLLPKTKEVK